VVRLAVKEAGISDMVILGDFPLAVAVDGDRSQARTLEFFCSDADACVKVGEAACDKVGGVSYVDQSGMLVVKWRCVTFRFGGTSSEAISELLPSLDIEAAPLNVELYSMGITPLMLAMDVLTEDITDPTGEAMADVEAKVVRSPVDPARVLEASPLCMFDAIYVASKHGFSIDSLFAVAAKNAGETDALAEKCWETIRAVGKGKASSIAEEYDMGDFVSRTTGG
jgi:hypothetical protein